MSGQKLLYIKKKKMTISQFTNFTHQVYILYLDLRDSGFNPIFPRLEPQIEVHLFRIEPDYYS